MGVGSVRLLVVCLLVGPAVALPGPTGVSTARVAGLAPQRPPNILLITTDDQNLRDMRYLPRTRRLLGRRGVTFRNMLAPHPLCCPARAQILTGQHAHNNGVRSNKGALLGGYRRLANGSTLATWLHGAGYRTAFVGRYLNGYHGQGPRLEPGWDIWNPTVRRGFRYYGYTMHESGAPRSYPGLNISDLVARRSRQYVETLGAGPDPFFIWASYLAPHGECRDDGCSGRAVPASRHRGLFHGVTSPSVRHRAFNEADVRDKPRVVARMHRRSAVGINVNHRSRIRSLQAVDEGVAGAVAALTDLGELADTLVVFTSDNALLMGEHRIVGKDFPYEPDLRVPLLMRGPGIPQGVTRGQTVTMLDLAPTILDVAGVRAGLTVDGRSLLPLARSPGRRGYDTVLIQAGPMRPAQVDSGWAWRGVRTRRYTYVRWYEPGFVELYDRRKDHAQLTNLAHVRRYRQVRRELADRTRFLARCAGAACRHRFGAVPPPR